MDAKWADFLSRTKREQYPNIDTEMPQLVPSVDGVWILKVTGRPAYTRKWQWTREGA
ncbi:MAG TPA: hypothetical protein VKF62_05875 [Planctomycetota bacterium]|nr:hypothetical protein [Planctomycetota bacterium]